MIALPICRWRKDHSPGDYICCSPKFANAPNIVSAAFCAKCTCANHKPLPPLPRALPCIHLGALAPREAGESQAQNSADHQLYTCSRYGRCNISATDHGRPHGGRNCANCSDYVAREVFAPTSDHMARQAEAFLTALADYPAGRYSGRGIVIAGGGDRFFPSLYVTIRAVRHVGCQLPIQVWHLGKGEMPAARRKLLAAWGVECVDAHQVRRHHPARRLGGWELKVFTTLHCPFEELLFLDADCYPCRNPEFLFERQEYRVRGAIFWPDSVATDPRLNWAAFGMDEPRHLGSVESGQFVLNKKLCWRPLNLTWFYNDHSDYYYRYCHGDKHTFEVAWARCQQPFVMWEPKSAWVDAAYVHSGPDLEPLFIHRCRDKFRFDNFLYSTPQYHPLPSFSSNLPLERECWQWMDELGKRIGRRASARGVKKASQSSKEKKAARFAVATLYTREIAALGRLTSRVLKAYARRHGYAAVVATSPLDKHRHPAWSKLLLIEGYLTSHPACEWMMWIDADAVITNRDRRLEEFVAPDVDFVIAQDLGASPMNSGVFLVRNCQENLAMLRAAYGKTQYLTHGLQEQPALYEALREGAKSVRTRIVSRKLFNAFPFEHQQGDFIKHFPGWSTKAKLAGVKKAIAQATSFSRQRKRRVSTTVHQLLPGNAKPREYLDSAFVHKTGWSCGLPPMFCITCWQTPERTGQARQHFRQRGLNVQFFPGIHGKTFGLRTIHEPRPRHRMPSGHVGVFLSHYMLWQTLAYLPFEEVLILEDDAWFPRDFKSAFLAARAELPKDWEFVFVGSTLTAGKPIQQVSPRVSVVRYPCGMHAYLVKRSILPSLLQNNHQIRNHLDYQLRETSWPAMKVYTFTPSLVKQRGSPSPLDGTGEYWPTTVNVPYED